LPTSTSPDSAMSNEIRLTSNSFLVFSLLETMGEATPYALKNVIADWGFWSLHHAQIYSEPQRLAKAGYLSERQEEGGRRRRYYAITDMGRKALKEWLGDPSCEADELRDLASLKLFFGADPKPLARVQLPARQAKLAEYEAQREAFDTLSPSDYAAIPGVALVLDAGIRHERVWVRFWERLIEED
jgi:PadR family transcriptional regulator, regulatory protein AphA